MTIVVDEANAMQISKPLRLYSVWPRSTQATARI